MRKLTVVLLIAIAAATVAGSQLRADAAPGKPWLGMALTLRQGPDGARFVYVAVVAKDTPAAKAGMAAGDVVTAINGNRVAFRDDLALLEFLASFKPGDTIRFGLVRSGKTQVIAVRAGTLPRA
jgi:serine protease Do